MASSQTRMSRTCSLINSIDFIVSAGEWGKGSREQPFLDMADQEAATPSAQLSSPVFGFNCTAAGCGSSDAHGRSNAHPERDIQLAEFAQHAIRWNTLPWRCPGTGCPRSDIWTKRTPSMLVMRPRSCNSAS